jgi:hypothetical protein
MGANHKISYLPLLPSTTHTCTLLLTPPCPSTLHAVRMRRNPPAMRAVHQTMRTAAMGMAAMRMAAMGMAAMETAATMDPAASRCWVAAPQRMGPTRTPATSAMGMAPQLVISPVPQQPWRRARLGLHLQRTTNSVSLILGGWRRRRRIEVGKVWALGRSRKSTSARSAPLGHLPALHHWPNTP